MQIQKPTKKFFNFNMISNLSLLRIRCFRTPPNTQIAESSTHSRISVSARSAAQSSLFEYLHGTRGFHYTDAEHISKNCPDFVNSLVSRVADGRGSDTSKALSRFLRYNPINEYEPFLESLGLSPNEVSAHLPHSLMFLVDSQSMLDNFHVLCDLGIPRSKIGKIFTEANEIFDYNDGVLALKITAYEGLGLSKSMVIKLISCCPYLLVGDDVHNDFLFVFERIKKLGFVHDWISGYLSDKSSYNWSRMAETIDFLDKLGYSEEQMRVLFETNPTLIFEGSGKKLYLLVGGLVKSGIRMNDIYSLLLQDPQVLSAKCIKHLCEAMTFLFEIGMESNEVAKIICTNMKLLSMHSLKRPRTVTRALKVDNFGLCQILKEDTSNLLKLASKSGTGEMLTKSHVNYLDKETFLLRLGYVENSDEMAKALKQFRGRGDQLQERFDCLVNAGLDPDDVRPMVKRAPSMLNQSKEVLEKKIDCLKNYLKYPVESVVGFPAYLCYDMDRINLRFSMFVWLRERGVVKPMLTLSTILACSDVRFVKYFVSKDPEGDVMWDKLKTSFNSS